MINIAYQTEKTRFAVNEMALRVHRRYATEEPQSLSNLDIKKNVCKNIIAKYIENLLPSNFMYPGKKPITCILDTAMFYSKKSRMIQNLISMRNSDINVKHYNIFFYFIQRHKLTNIFHILRIKTFQKA